MCLFSRNGLIMELLLSSLVGNVCVFVFQERVDYGALIEQLGGRLLDTQNFDQSCTHLIVGEFGFNNYSVPLI